jgi:hypothetical protein
MFEYYIQGGRDATELELPIVNEIVKYLEKIRFPVKVYRELTVRISEELDNIIRIGDRKKLLTNILSTLDMEKVGIYWSLREKGAATCRGFGNKFDISYVRMQKSKPLVNALEFKIQVVIPESYVNWEDTLLFQFLEGRNPKISSDEIRLLPDKNIKISNIIYEEHKYPCRSRILCVGKT